MVFFIQSISVNFRSLTSQPRMPVYRSRAMMARSRFESWHSSDRINASNFSRSVCVKASYILRTSFSLGK